jgi:hypothetical protein
MSIFLSAATYESVFLVVTAIKKQLYIFNQIINDRADWPEAASLISRLKQALIRIMSNLDAVATMEPDEQSIWFLSLIKNMLGTAGDGVLQGEAPDSSTIVFVLPAVWSGRTLSEASEQKTLFLLFLVDRLCADLKKVMAGVATLLSLQEPSLDTSGPIKPANQTSTSALSSGSGVSFGTITGCIVLGLLFIGGPLAVYATKRHTSY